MGEQVAKDMIAVRIGPDIRFAVVGAKSYFDKRAVPRTPQDLIDHNCINLRLPTYGGTYAWEFEKGGRELNVHVDGQLVFNSIFQVLDAALTASASRSCRRTSSSPISPTDGWRVLEDWCPPFSGYHLYYPNRRQNSHRLLGWLVDALRHHG